MIPYSLETILGIAVLASGLLMVGLVVLYVLRRGRNRRREVTPQRFEGTEPRNAIQPPKVDIAGEKHQDIRVRDQFEPQAWRWAKRIFIGVCMLPLFFIVVSGFQVLSEPEMVGVVFVGAILYALYLHRKEQERKAQEERDQLSQLADEDGEREKDDSSYENPTGYHTATRDLGLFVLGLLAMALSGLLFSQEDNWALLFLPVALLVTLIVGLVHAITNIRHASSRRRS